MARLWHTHAWLSLLFSVTHPKILTAFAVPWSPQSPVSPIPHLRGHVQPTCLPVDSHSSHERGSRVFFSDSPVATTGLEAGFGGLVTGQLGGQGAPCGRSTAAPGEEGLSAGMLRRLRPCSGRRGAPLPRSIQLWR